MGSTGGQNRAKPSAPFVPFGAKVRGSTVSPFCYKRGMATFTITLRTREDGGGIGTLRAALKLLLRRFGLRALKVEQTPEHD